MTKLFQPEQPQIELLQGPLQPLNEMHHEHCGALISFAGIVRGLEQGRSIDGLDYQIYQPMTHREMQRLAEQQMSKHGVVATIIRHSYGFVPTGRCSFAMQVASIHRGEGIAMIDEFILEMKRTVPIWKVPKLASGDS